MKKSLGNFALLINQGVIFTLVAYKHKTAKKRNETIKNELKMYFLNKSVFFLKEKNSWVFTFVSQPNRTFIVQFFVRILAK